jgi:hypothetical protein
MKRFKYPLMEYFLTNTPLDKCTKECQKQVKQLRKTNEKRKTL